MQPLLEQGNFISYTFKLNLFFLLLPIVVKTILLLSSFLLGSGFMILVRNYMYFLVNYRWGLTVWLLGNCRKGSENESSEIYLSVSSA